MRTLLSAFLVLVSLNAFAAPAAMLPDLGQIESEVLEQLILESASITLNDETGVQLPADQQLAPLIARQLRGGYFGLSNTSTQTTILTDTTVRCFQVTAGTITEGDDVTYSCAVTFADGTFETNYGAKVKGPLYESSYSISVEVTRKLSPGARPVFKTRSFNTLLAG